ncbi:MAG: metallophosphoesterase [Planctomycetaceae bacterium]|nr:metallophosphoesterase [Planctomycetaceae bacterium]
MYDIIGDIHGYAGTLSRLLDRLDYRKSSGIYAHPTRKVLFVGDFIDRGPEIRQTLEIVRPMVESGSALAVLGNHELNALAYHTPRSDSPGEFLRPHTAKNEHQHSETLKQLNQKEMQSALAWFKSLPLWLDLPELRVVHACWDKNCLQRVSEGLQQLGGISDPFLHSTCSPGEDLYAPVEVLLKGKEAKLPQGMSFTDKDGHERHDIRIRWFVDPAHQTFDSYSMTAGIGIDSPITPEVIEAADPYPRDAKPVFFGHYWLKAERPELLAPNVACVDYSVAKGGFLCAYRWEGEQQLRNENFIWES